LWRPRAQPVTKANSVNSQLLQQQNYTHASASGALLTDSMHRGSAHGTRWEIPVPRCSDCAPSTALVWRRHCLAVTEPQSVVCCTGASPALKCGVDTGRASKGGLEAEFPSGSRGPERTSTPSPDNTYTGSASIQERHLVKVR